MRRSFKTMLALAVMGAAFVLGADEAVKAAPGAVLSVYSLTDALRPDPDADPITVIVDRGDWFSYGNLSKNSETEKLNGQKLVLVWKGYIEIPAQGVYTFSASYVRTADCPENTFIQLNGKDFLNLYQRIKNDTRLNAVKSVRLAKGHYELTVISWMPVYYAADFTLKMWDKRKPLKKYVISPASMVHAE